MMIIMLLFIIQFMGIALEQAKKAAELGEVPIGAIVVGTL